MARNTLELVIQAEGRDKGKLFIITEMSARKAEMWGAKALNALARSNVQIPDSVMGAGIVGVWVMGVKMLFAMDFVIIPELLDEMMACAEFCPEPIGNPNYRRSLVGDLAVEDDVEEVATRIHLREQIFKLHVGFTPAEAISKLTSALSPQASSSAPTSPASSRRPSRRAKRRSRS